jgi:hypothetical protein
VQTPSVAPENERDVDQPEHAPAGTSTNSVAGSPSASVP